jgi:hypothetical protein
VSDISDTLRKVHGFYATDLREYMDPALLTEAADVIDALVEVLGLSFGAIIAAYEQALAEAQGLHRVEERHDKVVQAFKVNARAALARAKGDKP